MAWSFRRRIKVAPLLLLLLFSCSKEPGSGVDYGAGSNWVERPLEYWRQPEVYLDNQADVLFALVDETLVRNPAKMGTASAERRLALASLDALLHDVRNDDSPALHRFIDGRVGRIIEDLAGPVPKKGLSVYKIYNDGYIVRGRGLTVGFDLCGTRGNLKMVPDSMMRRLVGACDVLFISHRDPDHADRNVVSMAHDAGIPVYGPEDYENELVFPVRGDFKSANLETHGDPVSVMLLPGHQDGLQNNIYVVSFPDGFTVAHSGDQYNEEDMAWLVHVGERLPKPLDILIVNGWAMHLKETIEGFSPRLVISGHENEMGHSIDHREAFWLSQYKFDSMSLPMPALVMAWAERFDYRQ